MKKKIFLVLVCLLSLFALAGFKRKTGVNNFVLDIEEFRDYEKKYVAQEIDLCSKNSAKTYMDYRMTTVVSSRQYQFIHQKLVVDTKTGFLYDNEGFIAVALGSYFGEIGDRYYFTLESGVVLPLVKAEEKADVDTDSNGCYHLIDGSVIEFVIDEDYALAYFSHPNGLVLNGNYNNYELFNGSIVKVEKVSDQQNEKIITYDFDDSAPFKRDVFTYSRAY